MDIKHRFAVITTHNRPEYLQNCVDAIRPQVNQIVIVDNASDPPAAVVDSTIIKYAPQPPNLSAMWNLGLKAVQAYAVDIYDLTEWDVAVLNDDTVPYPDWMERVCTGIRSTTAVAGCTMPGLGGQVVYGPGVAPGTNTRVTGWAFVLRGESGARFDEQFQWWCGDDDISEYARQNGGLVMVPGAEVPNLLANSTTVGANLAQSAIDMQRFVDKHGRRPW